MAARGGASIFNRCAYVDRMERLFTVGIFTIYAFMGGMIALILTNHPIPAVAVGIAFAALMMRMSWRGEEYRRDRSARPNTTLLRQQAKDRDARHKELRDAGIDPDALSLRR